MYAKSKQRPTKTSIMVQDTVVEGEPIETKVLRITTNKEPIKDTAALIYTDRKDGVNAETNIRTDRWEHAVEGMGKVAQMRLAERDKRQGIKKDDAAPPQKGENTASNEGKA